MQVNENLLCHPHRDKAFEGPSVIVSFGEFLGGDLLLWRGDDGARPFIGMRCSVVFFTVRGAEYASKTAQSKLVHKGTLCDSGQVQAA